MKTCEETACADTSGELEQKELKEKYLIARTLLKVSHFYPSLAPFPFLSDSLAPPLKLLF